MYNPKDVMSDMIELEGHLFNMKNALFYFINNADDLHIGALDETQLTILYEMEKLMPLLRTGDGEELEY